MSVLSKKNATLSVFSSTTFCTYQTQLCYENRIFLIFLFLNDAIMLNLKSQVCELLFVVQRYKMIE